MYTEDQLALVNEIVPRTLRSLFVLRITFCVVAAALALVKICLVRPTSEHILDVISDVSTRDLFQSWFSALNLLVSGLLASLLALVVATFFIQARIRGHAEQEMIAAPAETGAHV